METMKDDPTLTLPARPGKVLEEGRRRRQIKNYDALLTDEAVLGEQAIRRRASWSSLGDPIPGGERAGNKIRKERLGGVCRSVTAVGAQRVDSGMMLSGRDLLIARVGDTHHNNRRPQGRHRSRSLSISYPRASPRVRSRSLWSTSSGSWLPRSTSAIGNDAEVWRTLRAEREGLRLGRSCDFEGEVHGLLCRDEGSGGGGEERSLREEELLGA